MAQKIEKISVSISSDLLKWIDEEIEKDHFAAHSYAIRASLREMKEILESL